MVGSIFFMVPPSFSGEKGQPTFLWHFRDSQQAQLIRMVRDKTFCGAGLYVIALADRVSFSFIPFHSKS